MSCAISARGLRYSYPSGQVALNGVDLAVEHGERLAVLGPNGAGKTTFVLHLNALLMGGGELEVAGLRVEKETVWDLRERVGLVFQDPDDQLFMPTAREDVSFGPLNMKLPRDVVEARVALDIEVEPALGAEALAKLLDSAEWGCFVGASLTAKPTYEWRVNGETVR